jgi:hypothetical protein
MTYFAEMSEAEHMEWLRAEGIDVLDLNDPSEENLCRLVSDALRMTDREAQALRFIDIANMSLALADKTRGAQRIVPQCLVLHQH